MGGAVGLGAKSYMQFGRESTWGTAVTCTKRIPILTHRFKQVIGQVRSEELDGVEIGRSTIYNVAEHTTGTIEMYLSYEDLNLIWDGIFGTATFGSNGGSTSGSGPYTHTFIGKSILNSYTIELGEGDIPTSKVSRIEGGKFVGFTITTEAGPGDAHMCKLTLEVVGKRKLNNQNASATLTANSRNMVMASHATTFDDGTADSTHTVRMMEFSYKRPVIFPRPNVGTIYSDEPIANSWPVATMKFRKEYQSKTLSDAWVAGTSGDPNVTFVNSTRQLTIQMDTAKLVDYDHGLDDYDVMYQDFTWEGIRTSGPFDMKLIAVNAQALITT